ncbi:MAG TPA: amino acid adenylation domain-containing protein, partial [Thermoanaerobaculia bacterium]|nr:amino acid adenylation domain-containing protein [Thermoanaerobaculia bacterium]
HILLDGWSLGVLLRDLFAHYAALSRGGTADLPASRSFADYVAWLERQSPARTRAFWQGLLAGIEAPTVLGAEGSRRGDDPLELAEHQRRLPAALSAGLQAAARRMRLTLSTLVQGAWAVLLARAGGGREVVFGTVVSGRPADLPGVEAIVGPFLNTLPLRVDVPEDEPAGLWLRGLQALLVEIRQHEFTPLTEIRKWSRIPADLPLFEHIFAFENYPVDSSMGGAGLGIELRDARLIEATHYPLTVTAAPGDEIALQCLYDLRRFDAVFIERLFDRWTSLLGSLLDPADRRVGDLGWLSEEEVRQLLAGWDGGAAPEAEPLVFERFAAAAARWPERAALVAGGGVLTSGEILERSLALAGELRALGVGPEVLVGVATERAPAMVVALLGVLAAGGAYVPLDPAFPAQRLAFLLADSRPAVLVAQPEALRHLPAPGMPVVLLAEDGGVLEPAAGRLDRAAPADPAHLAYVLYTSGSTGSPKGTQIPHRALARFLDAVARRTGLGADDVLLAVTTLSFDIAALEIFLPLVEGARCVIASREEAADPGRLAELLAASGATAMQATPATWRMLLDTGWAGRPGLKILCGGEALAPDLAAALLAGGAELWNLYGPTETTVWSAVARVASGEAIHLGRPLDGESLLLLGEHGQPAPSGFPGEICIGGAGLARGYLGRPELTAERFIPHPWSGRWGIEPGARLYRTGDLGRFDSGRLEFLGRLDSQVKIRGVRIEPGEIEAALATHPAVRQAVVLARRERGSSLLGLVAWVVPAPGAALDAGDLRRFLRERLPETLVPAAFVPLEHLPRTPNGKIDRRALPDPGERALAAAVHVPPRTETERELAGLWRQILDVPRVGRSDSFFELGGHSLRIIQLAFRIQEAFGVEVPFRSFFAAPTLEGMARAIAEGTQPAREPIPPAPGERRDFPLTFDQEQLWFLAQLDPGGRAYNVYAALCVEGELEVGRLRRALAALTARHETLRTRFAGRAEGPRQIVLPTGGIPLQEVDLRPLPEARRAEEERALVESAAGRAFDLERGPLAFLQVLRRAPGDSMLVLVIHHLVADGWSLGIFLQELWTLYEAGESAALPGLPVQYGDYALWSRRWVEEGRHRAHLQAWLERLRGDLPVLRLPGDRAVPAARSPRGGWQAVTLPAAVSEPLRHLGRRHRATSFMTFLALFKVLLHRLTGERDLLVGSPLAQRTRRETLGLIGFFPNLAVLRTRLDPRTGFAGLLSGVRETVLAAQDHQDLPFEVLLEALRPDRAGRQAPLFQAAFTFGEAGLLPAAPPGLRVTPMEIHNRTAKWDLSFHLEAEAGGVRVGAEHRLDFLDGATVQRWLGHFAALATAAAAEPGRALADLPWWTPAERWQILAEWNDREEELPGGSLPELFAAQVRRAPAAEALCFTDAVLTYGELSRRSAALAGLLRRRGVVPGDRIGVFLERSAAAVVALLGVLRAGGAYVPLDTGAPAERLAVVAGDAGLRMVVTQTGFQERLGGLEVVTVDGLAAPAGEEVDPQLSAGLPAYVIYTSGSTGRPKGVAVSHRAVARLAFDTGYVRLRPGDRVAQASTLAFDAATFEIWSALLNGACVVGLSREEVLDPRELARCLRERRVDVLFLTTALFHQMVREAPGSFAPVRDLLFGGQRADLRIV